MESMTGESSLLMADGLYRLLDRRMRATDRSSAIGSVIRKLGKVTVRWQVLIRGDSG